MSNLCSKYIAKLTKIKDLQSQLLNEFDSLANYQTPTKEERKELSDELVKFFRLRSQLRNLIEEIIKELSKVSVEQAEMLIGQENFFGPKEIQTAFNFKKEIASTQIPEIGFTKEELERAKELNQFLVLRIKRAPDGEPLTMKKIMELKENKTADGGKLLYDTDWHQNEDFFTNQPLELSWALVTRDVVKETTNRNYLKQYDVLIAYLTNEVFKNQPLPKEYQEAITEFKQKKADIEANLTVNWQVATKTLEDLKITKLLRRTPAEILYDLVVTVDGKPNGQKLLPSTYDWSSGRDAGGYLVHVGSLDFTGAGVAWDSPDDSDSILGVCLSRNPSLPC